MVVTEGFLQVMQYMPKIFCPVFLYYYNNSLTKQKKRIPNVKKNIYSEVLTDKVSYDY